MCENLKNGQSQRYVWILSRTPTLSAELLADAHQRIEKDFDVNALVSVKQDRNICEPRPWA